MLLVSLIKRRQVSPRLVSVWSGVAESEAGKFTEVSSVIVSVSTTIYS